MKRPITRKQKRISPSMNKLVDEKHYGQEPIFNRTPTDMEFLSTLNWYNYMHGDYDKAKEFLLEYMKENKYPSKDISCFRKIESWKINSSFGWISRQLSLGSIVPEEKIHKLKKYLENPPKEKKEEVKEEPIIRTDKTKAKTSELIALLDEELDKGETFSPYEIFMTQETSPIIAKTVVERFKPILNELEEARQGKDSLIKEGYKHLTKKQLSEKILQYNSIVEDACRIINNTKMVRKPRKKKIKSVTEQTNKVQYKKEDSFFKIKSIDPSLIIDSKQLWTFNTKTRILSVYNSESLRVRRTTLDNFDSESSISKKLRKPEEILNMIVSGTKPSLKKLMSTIKTKESPANGRLNSDTILMRVIK